METAGISSVAHPVQAARRLFAAQDADGADAAGGFGALFTALLAVPRDGDAPLDADHAAADPAGTTPADTAPAATAQGAVDASALAAWQGLLAPAAAAQAGTGEPDAQAADAILSAQGPQGGAGAGPGLPQGLVAETALLDHGEARAQAPTDASAGAARGALAPGAQAAGPSNDCAAPDTAAPRRPAPRAAPALQAAGERVAGVLGNAQGAMDRTAGAQAAAAATGTGTPARALDGLLAALPPARAGESGAGGSRRDAEPPGAGVWSGAGPGSAWAAPGPVGGAGPFAHPGLAAAPAAEPVTWWAEQQTWNAQLTLDRDGQPVEVSVSLSGNAAHVFFQSEQPQTRELLDRSRAQLGDLLHSQGLVLAGMSVGTSADQGAGQARSPRGRAGARPTQGMQGAPVASVAPAAAAPVLRVGNIAQRAVDVFV
ncbi:flagellar hook-length control protein FliK [Verminephrobacter aporrectodeae]|nr:flagellar hook-length control protein FliK [Verminephrobacter aporrectodeae]